MPCLIINADDFGRSIAINRAVIRAHESGILTSASLMVTGEAWQDAVERARHAPGLAVGLHLVLVRGRAILPPERIPHLADAEGRFDNHPARAGWRYFFSAAARRELADETAGQFERFAQTGLPLSHVDGHLQMHVHPAVFPTVVELARQHGARGLRLPRDRIWPALTNHPRRGLSMLARHVTFRVLSHWCARQLRGSTLQVPRFSHGLLMSGRMQESYVHDLIARQQTPSEIYFHPTEGAPVEPLGPNPGDLQTLLSPRLCGLAREGRVRLTNYAGLDEVQAPC